MNREQSIDAIADCIYELEPGLDPVQINDIVGKALDTQPKAVRLLESLSADPRQLTNGSDALQPALAKIIRELRAQGAQAVQPPRCYQCHQERALPAKIGPHRICATCYKRERTIKVQCFQCGNLRQRNVEVSGHFYCGTCWKQLLPTAYETLFNALKHSNLQITDQQAAQSARNFTDTGRPADCLRTALELELNAEQWFENPAAGSALFIRLHETLRLAGVNVTPLACGKCGKQPSKRMANVVNGVRCCGRCYRQSKAATCAQCGRTQIIVTHTAQGEGICQTCMKKLPERLEQCVFCGTRRYVAWQSPSGPVCSVCRPKQRLDICTICHKEKPCLFVGTADARCHECSKPQKRCGECGKIRRVLTHKPDGTPVCHVCGRRRENCSQCGKNRIVVARINADAWCEYCYQRSEVSYRDCRRCSAHERLFATELCAKCSAEDALEAFLPEDVRNSNPLAQAIYTVCQRAKPTVILSLSRRRSTALLRTILEAPENLSHEYLDSAGSDAMTRGIRSLLVDAELLEPRDHHLARFEQWILIASESIADPKLRTSFVQFARWRHLRELMSRPSPIPGSLTIARRRELRLVLELIAWLQEQGVDFYSLSQSDVDHWRTFGSNEKYRVKEFLLWANENKLIDRVEIRRPPRTDLNVIGFSEESRNRILVKLLDDQCLWSAVTRFSALLVLLFGARPQQITRLKVSDILVLDSGTYLKLGQEPVLLPDILTRLASAILGERTVARQFTSAEEMHWLLPGSTVGYPMSPSALAKRLRSIEIPASTGRTSAMAILAQSLPPTIVARLTGTTASTAIRWTSAVSASNARYAALTMANKQ